MPPPKAVRSWSTVFGFSSVPGSPAEARAFLQKRVALYVGLMTAFWGLDLVSYVGFRVFGLAPFGFVFWFDLFGTALLALLTVFVRRGERSIALLLAVDVCVTLAQAGVQGYLLSRDDARLFPDTNLLLATVHLFVVRAAVVPSTAARTAAIGTVASIPMLAGSWLCFTRAELPAYFPSITTILLNDANWLAIAIACTAVISRVIYGLRQKVAEALQLGQYSLEEKLGEGGMGVVYRARHALLRRPTAIKLLPLERAGATAIARFEREVQLTSQLTHPHLISIYDFGRTPDGLFYYAMEYVDGLDLETLVRLDGPQPAGRVLSLLSQAASALDEAHRAGLIHRDIKPANLLLGERGRQGDFVKVLDFGLVKELSQTADPALSGAETLAGTPLYMAPEALTGREQVDARSDLYALGALGYFLLTGRPVFEGRSVVEVCAHHLHSPVVPMSERAGVPVPAKLEAVVLSCLAKDPGARPASAEALLEALAACDDVPPWTAQHARRWWAERGASLRQRARGAEAPAGSGTTRLEVDLSRRAA